MVDRDHRPKLRRVEAFPVEVGGQRLIGIRDPAGFTPAIVLLPLPLLDVVSLFDGDHSIGDIQEILMRRYGELVAAEDLGKIADSLDDQGFLDSSKFAARRDTIERVFRESPTRAAAHAGGAYAEDAEALRAQMDGFFSHADGPGALQWTSADGEDSVRGLVAPHIDFHRGGPAYAWGYGDLARSCDAELFVILGTCHAGMAEPFAVTLKPYDTPLGPTGVDHDFVASLARRSGQDLFASELAHRTEHSIEFQAVFLRYLFGARRDVTVVPVLASFVHEAIAQGVSPETDPRVPRFLDALAETIAASGRRVCVIAGADLAHVGPRFGDPEPVSPTTLAELDREDRAMLAHVEAGDPGGFFESAARDDDRRRVCGLSPIYALLRVVGGARGELRRYAQWPDPQGTVTFASVLLR